MLPQERTVYCFQNIFFITNEFSQTRRVASIIKTYDFLVYSPRTFKLVYIQYLQPWKIPFFFKFHLRVKKTILWKLRIKALCFPSHGVSANFQSRRSFTGRTIKIYGVSISAKKLVSQFYCVKKSLKTLKFKARAV